MTRPILLARLTAFALGVALTSPAMAATDNASGRARVLRQLSIVHTGDLDFGTVLRGTTAGRVVIAPGTGARTVSGGVIAAGGTPRSASFTVSGSANRVVRITVTPGSTTLTNGSGGTMIVNTFRLNGSANRRLNAAGNATIRVGARLNVAANQADGVYTGSFNLTVDYL